MQGSGTGLRSPVVTTSATPAERRRHQIRARNDGPSPLDSRTVGWTVAVDGVTVQEGELVIPSLDVGEEALVHVPCHKRVLDAGQEAHLTLDYGTAADGTDLGVVQLAMPWKQRPAAADLVEPDRPTLPFDGASDGLPTVAARVQVDRDRAAGRLVLSDDRCLRVEVDEGAGGLARLRWDGMEVLRSSPRLDLGPWWPGPDQPPLHRTPSGAAVRSMPGGAVALATRRRLWAGDATAVVTHRHQVVVHPSGDLVFEEEVAFPDHFGPRERVGMELELVGELTELEWFGSGPEAGPRSTVGRWSGVADGPRSADGRRHGNGPHGRTRWFVLRHDGATGHGRAMEGRRVGVLVQGLEPDRLAFAVGRAGAAVVVRAAPVDRSAARTDDRPPDRWTWRWRLRPFTVGVEDPVRLVRQPPV